MPIKFVELMLKETHPKIEIKISEVKESSKHIIPTINYTV